jgi:regulator of sirC expression with transglutaminase-like and TPR domain
VTAVPHRASQLNNVMEHGLGSPVVMAMLYMEVAMRAGLRLAPLLLDGGAAPAPTL